MNYYIYKNADGVIIGYNQTDRILPPPAIEVSKEEFIELGFYKEPPKYSVVDDTEIETEEDIWTEMADAIKEGVNEV